MSTKIYSLHIGVSYADTDHYGNTLIPLPCCVVDAHFMYGMAQRFQYDKSTLLLNEEATASNVKDKIIEYSQTLNAGDLCIITYSGHGAQLPDFNGDEISGADQTWCLYDRQLIDDELRRFWKEFNPGVNVFVFLDSCHSGTAIKEEIKVEGPTFKDYLTKVKAMDKRHYIKNFTNNRDLYIPLLHQATVSLDDIKCSVFSLSACRDKEEALAGSFVSYFTRIVINTLANAHHEIKNYRDLHEKVLIQSVTEKNIHPHIDFIGDTSFFEQTLPFLQADRTYPDQMERLYIDLFIENGAFLDKKIQDEGLLIELVRGPEEKFKEEVSRFNSTLSPLAKNPKYETPLFHFNFNEAPKAITTPWDKAYHAYDYFHEQGYAAYIEPALALSTLQVAQKKSEDEASNNQYLASWPSSEGQEDELTWHLQEKYSQLAPARDWIIDNIPADKRHIKIAHIDTGFHPEHPLLPANIGNNFSFVNGEENLPAHDKIKSGKMAEQDYHGTATLALLAGKEVPEELAYGVGDRQLGAAPFAIVHPLRISDTVALVLFLNNTVPFIKAVRKAIELKCEVISISMGGAPIKGWKKVINEAYEAGITVVAAAGNSWDKGIKKILPKRVLYPARYERVIAATGVTHNGFPYDFDANPHQGVAQNANGDYMQGNYLPASAMKSAIAAYTPNIAWAQFDDNDPTRAILRKAGGGTSSATPQVAAAVAMWLIKNREELEEKCFARTWRQVEAVKHALFATADKSYDEYKKYYGHGTLKAMDALMQPVPEEHEITKAKPAKNRSGLIEFIKLVVLRKSLYADLQKEEFDEVKATMVLQEIQQILETDTVLATTYQNVDLDDPEYPISKEEFSEILEAVKRSPYASAYLKSMPKI